MKLGAAGRAADALDAKPDFGERYRADVEKIERLRGDEGKDFSFRLGAAQLGQDVGIEQPARHKATLRTGIGVRLGSMSMSRCGEASHRGNQRLRRSDRL